MAKRAPKRAPMTPEQLKAFNERMANVLVDQDRAAKSRIGHETRVAAECGQTRAEYVRDVARYCEANDLGPTAEDLGDYSDGI